MKTKRKASKIHSKAEGLLVFGRVISRPKRINGQDRGVLSKMQSMRRTLHGAATVAPDVLRSNLTAFLEKIDDVVRGLPARVGEYSLDTVELTVEITAKGEVGLFGTGGGIEGKGGLTFSLKREKPGGVG